MATIKIIVGSTRPGRFGIQAAGWIQEEAQAVQAEFQAGPDPVRFELLDIQDFNLPLLDEEKPAVYGAYAKDHTKAWAKAVGEADGFVFVSPEYNHSVGGALKNAIDYLAAEWKHKPAALVTYGAAAGGVRAAEHLRGILGHLGVYDISETLLLVNYWTQLDAQGRFVPTDDQRNFARTQLRELAFWTTRFKEARAKRA